MPDELSADEFDEEAEVAMHETPNREEADRPDDPTERTPGEDAREAGDALEANWRMVGDLKLPWGPRLDLRGAGRRGRPLDARRRGGCSSTRAEATRWLFLDARRGTTP